MPDYKKIEQLKYDLQEIAAENSPIVGMTFVQFITAFYKYHKTSPDVYQLVQFFPTLTTEEIVLCREAIIKQWQIEVE